MKKILSFILLFALCFGFSTPLWAQHPANRTSKTIVADVLAQMPSKNEAIYDAMMEDLVSSGQEGITLLCSMINDPGKGDNAKVSFAIGGLAYYVGRNDREAQRLVVSEALATAMEESDNRETKAFLMRMLQIAGGDEVVELLTKYAKGGELQEDAIMALSYINTEKSLGAIISLAPEIEDVKIIAQVAAERELTELCDLVLAAYPSSDAHTQTALTHALAKMNSTKALETLSKAAKKIKYGYDEHETTTAFLVALEAAPYSVSKKYLGSLIKSSVDNVRSEALAIAVENNDKNVGKWMADAVKKGTRVYRNNALTIAVANDMGRLTADAVIEDFAKYDLVAQCDVLNWLAANRITGANQEAIQAANSGERELRRAGLKYLGMIGTKNNISAIAALLSSSDKDVVSDATEVLMWVGKKNFSLNNYKEAVANASKEGTLAIYEILKNRRMVDMLPFIEKNLDSNNAELRKAAYEAFVTCATLDNPEEMFARLAKASDPEDVKYIQSAVGKQLGILPAQKALGIIKNNGEGVAKDKIFALYAFVPNAQSLTALKQEYENAKNSADKALAATAICNWPTAEGLDDIYGVLAQTNDEAIRDLAISNSVKVIVSVGGTDDQKFLTLRRLMPFAKTAAQKTLIIDAIGLCDTYGAFLFVAPYMEDADVAQRAAMAIQQIALKDVEYERYGENVEKILNRFLEVRRGGDAEYEKQGVYDYIAGAPKGEKGYVQIFNGKNLDGWKGLVGNPITRAKMSASELAKAQEKVDKTIAESWVIKDGELHFTGHGDNLCTDKKYGNFEMLIDWKIYYEGNPPLNKREGDAGIYLRGSPQVQIWDTCRVNVGAQVGSGGLYNNQKNPSKPLVMADNKIGEWNTVYIKMVGERVTIYQNGQLVVDNVILENYWDRSIPIFNEEQIELQAHGSLVAYRDIYVKELPGSELTTLNEEEKADGFELLFDGMSMNNWQGNTKDYVAENGTITLYPKNGGGGNLYTKKEYSDFVLRFEFKLTPAANNGLGIRTPMGVDAAYEGMELQILDNTDPVFATLEKYQYHGSVYGIIAAKRGALKPLGEWNVQEVVADGDNIKITLNGEVILEGNIREASKGGEATLDGQKHPGLFNEKGYIGFLGHGSEVSFRNIRIKELK